MYYVGLDLHQKTTSVCVLDENGKILKERRIRGAAPTVLKELIAELPRPFVVCFEASEAYGFWYEALSRIAERVVPAHPGHLRLIFRAKRKNDRVDARKLAKLLYLDEVPPVYVPHADVRAWRRLIVYRDRLVSERTRTKNRLRGLLRREGLQVPTGMSLWTRKGCAWLADLELAQPTLALERDLGLDELARQSVRIKRVEAELDRIAARHPGTAILLTIKGVGPRTAEAVLAWVDNPRRFKRHSIGSYFGLVPCQDASADRNRLGHITRQGPSVVRKLLVEAAWQTVRFNPEFRALHTRLMNGDPDRNKIAIVGVAHTLLRQMHGMLKHNAAWHPQAA